MNPHQSLHRRAFLKEGTLILLGAAAGSRMAAEETAEPRGRVGLVTDLHYADKAPSGSRHYRETLAKLEAAAADLGPKAPARVVELGDFIDAADTVEAELGYLKRLRKTFAALPGRKHYVLGNHCVHTLTKPEFLGGVEQEGSFFSFEESGFHFVGLDACFRSDGQAYGRKNFDWKDPNVPEAQLEWLRADLAQAVGPVVVFVHQRLDVGAPYGVKNAPRVRHILEASGKVRAVFQGHSHKSDYHRIGGIHFVTLVAMVEGSGPEQNGYSLLNLFPDGSLSLEGFRRQESRSLG